VPACPGSQFFCVVEILSGTRIQGTRMRKLLVFGAVLLVLSLSCAEIPELLTICDNTSNDFRVESVELAPLRFAVSPQKRAFDSPTDSSSGFAFLGAPRLQPANLAPCRTRPPNSSLRPEKIGRPPLLSLRSSSECEVGCFVAPIIARAERTAASQPSKPADDRLHRLRQFNKTAGRPAEKAVAADVRR